MIDAASSTCNEVAPFQSAQETKITLREVAAVRWFRDAFSRGPSAQDRYLGAAIDHDDFERRRKAWDAHEEGALHRLSVGLY